MSNLQAVFRIPGGFFDEEKIVDVPSMDLAQIDIPEGAIWVEFVKPNPNRISVNDPETIRVAPRILFSGEIVTRDQAPSDIADAMTQHCLRYSFKASVRRENGTHLKDTYYPLTAGRVINHNSDVVVDPENNFEQIWPSF